MPRAGVARAPHLTPLRISDRRPPVAGSDWFRCARMTIEAPVERYLTEYIRIDILTGALTFPNWVEESTFGV